MNRFQGRFRTKGMTGTNIFLAVGFSLLLNSCAPKSSEDALNIAVAANMQFAIADLTEAFTKSSGIPCQVTVSSSGKLAAQIRAGAPYDVFLSADLKYPETLYQEGFAKSPPAVYGYGKLVLWTLVDTLTPNLSLLADSKIRHIAIANPQTAPYGAAAKEVLTASGIWHDIEPKLVFGESIAQVNQFVYSGAAQLGITAKSAVLSPNVSGTGNWVELPESKSVTIAQGMILLKGSSQKETAGQSFFDYLLTPEATEILKNYGFEIPQQVHVKEVNN